MSIRLDVLLTLRGLCASRERARRAIKSGAVCVDGRIADKPGANVNENAKLEIRCDPDPFVSRGGLKLQKALDFFDVSLHGLSCLDVGASSGGFTDCMLKNGASHVWAVDVGHDQLDQSLRGDSRVTVMESTDIRRLTPGSFDKQINFAAIDVSFISLRLVLPTVKKLVSENAEIIALIKPQFEAGRERVGKNGVIRDGAVHLYVLEQFLSGSEADGFVTRGVTFSPVKGSGGNIEFLALLTANGAEKTGVRPPFDFKPLVLQAHKELRE